MRYVFFFCFCLFTFAGAGQTLTEPDTALSARPRLLVIPFESRMYMSQIDRQVAAHEHVSFSEIVEKVRESLVEALAFELDDETDAYTLYPRNDSLRRELHYVYSSIEYEYLLLEEGEALQGDPKETRLFSRRNSPDKKETPPGKSSGIQQGQLVAEGDSREQYMATVLLNANLTEELSFRNVAYFVFLNQLDILYAPDDPSRFRLKLHYTCLDSQGNIRTGGAAIHSISSRISDLSVLKNEGLMPLAREVGEKIKLSLKTLSKP